MASKQNAVIFSETKAEWIIFALSCFRINVPVATLYSTLGIDALKHGINETEATHVITSSDQLTKFDVSL
jgi:long-chain acyl-CoA synthetase